MNEHFKCIREFVVPRERVTPEVARAFQSILLSLQNLEKKYQAMQADLNKLGNAVADMDKRSQKLERSNKEVTPTP